ncbi:MAG TPA: hypothetical protein PKM82_11725 [Acidovorax sp.]|jgi:hypothetical protein|nr:hypothetical protein [Acidovorax sp.]
MGGRTKHEQALADALAQMRGVSCGHRRQVLCFGRSRGGSLEAGKDVSAM